MNKLKAIIKGDKTIVKGNDSITLYNRGHYGIPIQDGLILDGFETLHLVEIQKIDVFLNNELLTTNKITQYFENIIENYILRYLVYKDLRNRGYLLNVGKGSSFFFRLYERSNIPTRDQAKFYIIPLFEGGGIQIEELENVIQIASLSDKILVLALVDANGDISYLKISEIKP